jgi:hypothetical protein
VLTLRPCLTSQITVLKVAPQGLGSDGRIEVALPSLAAAFLGVKPGDHLLVAHSFDDCNRPPPTDDPEEARERARFRCVPQVFITLHGRLTVTGIFEANDINEPYWSAGRLLFDRPAATDTQGAVVPIVLGEEGFFHDLARVFPGISSEFRVTASPTSTANSANLDQVRARLEEPGRCDRSRFPTWQCSAP